MWWFRHHARRFIRSVMRPVNQNVAHSWLIRTRIAYILTGLGTFSFSLYIYYKNKEVVDQVTNLDPSLAHKHMRMKGGSGKVVINRIGWGGSERFEYDNEQYIAEYNERAKKLEETLNVKLLDTDTKTKQNINLQ